MLGPHLRLLNGAGHLSAVADFALPWVTTDLVIAMKEWSSCAGLHTDQGTGDRRLHARRREIHVSCHRGSAGTTRPDHRAHHQRSSPSTRAVTGHHHDGAPPASPSASARNLWEAKIVQLHYEAFLDGVELYPLDADGCCTTCGVHVLAIQNMRQDELTHHPS